MELVLSNLDFYFIVCRPALRSEYGGPTGRSLFHVTYHYHIARSGGARRACDFKNRARPQEGLLLLRLFGLRAIGRLPHALAPLLFNFNLRNTESPRLWPRAFRILCRYVSGRAAAEPDRGATCKAWRRALNAETGRFGPVFRRGNRCYLHFLPVPAPAAVQALGQLQVKVAPLEQVQVQVTPSTALSQTQPGTQTFSMMR